MNIPCFLSNGHSLFDLSDMGTPDYDGIIKCVGSIDRC